MTGPIGTKAKSIDARAGAWLRYAALALIAVLLLAAALGWLLGGASARAVWLAAAVAWPLQLVAFGVLVAVRRDPRLFLAGWLGGMLLRASALFVVALAARAWADLPMAPLLVSLVGFMFLLVLMEPLYLRWGLETA